MQLAYIIMLTIGAVACWYTVILYITTQKNWWNPVAQVILVKAAALGLILTWVLIIRLWPSVPGRNVIGFILFALVTSAMVWKAYVLSKLFRIIKRERFHVRFTEKDQPRT